LPNLDSSKVSETRDHMAALVRWEGLQQQAEELPPCCKERIAERCKSLVSADVIFLVVLILNGAHDQWMCSVC
jgi:hypothetical protein